MIRLQFRIFNRFPVIKRYQSASTLSSSPPYNQFTRSFSNFENIGNDGIRTFNELLAERQHEARCSIVVQVNSENSYSELYRYCSQIGPIKNAFHYCIGQKTHRILIEYESKEAACDAIKSSVFDGPQIPAASRFMWFRATKSKLAACSATDDIPALKAVDGFNPITDNALLELLLNENSMDDQIERLYNSTCITDLGTRLRFLAALQIENSVSGIFPYAKVYPFGSSVNGFGKIGSDLDMNVDVLPTSHVQNDEQDNYRLVFHTRSAMQCDRSVAQRHLSIMADIIHQILPGISSVKSILLASVPIVRYQQEYLNLQVDLSMNNMSGVYMSELLYLLGELDRRVRPLMFCIRRWAQKTDITCSHPGNWISNFGLTCLVIYFLQQSKQPVLPTLNYLNSLGGNADIRQLESSKVTYIRDFNSVDFKTENTRSLSELLYEFFQFYSKFEFAELSMSLHTGQAIEKMNNAAMHIINPIEPTFNVTKNVNARECDRLQMQMRIASESMETEMESTGNVPDKTKEWGLAQLFKHPALTSSARVKQIVQDSIDAGVPKNAIQNKARRDVANLLNVKSLYSYAENSKDEANNAKDTNKPVRDRSMVDRLMKQVNLKPKQNETSITATKKSVHKKGDARLLTTAQGARSIKRHLK